MILILSAFKVYSGVNIMDCNKVGKLIFELRREKNMTQKEIADKMNISDKTISKWERGIGCPDVSLLPELSDILGVNIEKILAGYLNANDTDGGNMKRIKFYICPFCGNTITSTGSGDFSCCGRKLNVLAINETTPAHIPTIEEIENDYYITFSHEMCKQHFISFVAYVMTDRVLLIRLYPEQEAQVRFPKIYRGELYYYCSEHGLMKQKL